MLNSNTLVTVVDTDCKFFHRHSYLELAAACTISYIFPFILFDKQNIHRCSHLLIRWSKRIFNTPNEFMGFKLVEVISALSNLLSCYTKLEMENLVHYFHILEATYFNRATHYEDKFFETAFSLWILALNSDTKVLLMKNDRIMKCMSMNSPSTHSISLSGTKDGGSAIIGKLHSANFAQELSCSRRR